LATLHLSSIPVCAARTGSRILLELLDTLLLLHHLLDLLGGEVDDLVLGLLLLLHHGLLHHAARLLHHAAALLLLHHLRNLLAAEVDHLELGLLLLGLPSETREKSQLTGFLAMRCKRFRLGHDMTVGCALERSAYRRSPQDRVRRRMVTPN
jgi:hypothetical protein